MDITEALDTIPGWFSATDVALFRWFLSAQVQGGMRGDLAELGVYLGRSAVLIGHYRQPSETFTVVDLFDSETDDIANRRENQAYYPGLAREAFEVNYQRVLGSLPVVIEGFSASIVDHASHGTHRFVHVDASHLYEHVYKDVQSARRLLSPDGVVVFDDIRSEHTPGVAAAVWEAVVTDGLCPIVISENKLYGTWGDFAEWQRRLSLSMPATVRYESQEVLGRRLLRTWTETPGRQSRVLDEWAPPVARRFAGRVRRHLRRQPRS